MISGLLTKMFTSFALAVFISLIVLVFLPKGILANCGIYRANEEVCATVLGVIVEPYHICTQSTNWCCHTVEECDRFNNPKDEICTSAAGIGIDSAIGCIPFYSLFGLISFIVRWSIAIAGGIGFILIGYSGILIITSGAHPERLQAGKELLTSAIAGIFFLVFSFALLYLIGIYLLGLGEIYLGTV